MDTSRKRQEVRANNWKQYRKRHFKRRAGVILDDGTVVTACGTLLVVEQDDSWSVVLNKETVRGRTVVGDLGGKMEWKDIRAVAATPNELFSKKMEACRHCAQRELYEESNGELDIDLCDAYHILIPNANSKNSYLLFVKFVSSEVLPDTLTEFGEIETATGFRREIILLDTSLFESPPFYELHMRLIPRSKHIQKCLEQWQEERC